jgi:hypothetical protein
MGSRSLSSRKVGGSIVVAIAAQSLLLALPVQAQSHADAGVQHHAAAPAEPPATEPGDRSGLKAIPDPAQLSESVRARLQEQAAGRHPSNLAQEPPRPLHELPSAAAGSSAVGAPSFRRVTTEPLRRGEARMRRVQAVETVEGVTILSNRMMELPERTLTAMAMRRPPPPEAVEDEPSALASGSRVTETHSLRTLASRTVTPKTHSTGLGWLLWPFALFVTTGAVVGALWFRKKVS